MRAPHPAHPRERLPPLGITSSAAAHSGCECMAGFSLPAAPPQPSCRTALLYPGKALPAPRLSGVHAARGSMEQGGPHPSGHRVQDALTTTSAALGVPFCSPAPGRCLAGTASMGWVLGKVPPPFIPRARPARASSPHYKPCRHTSPCDCTPICARYEQGHEAIALFASHTFACKRLSSRGCAQQRRKYRYQQPEPQMPPPGRQRSPRGHRAAAGPWHHPCRPAATSRAESCL